MAAIKAFNRNDEAVSEQSTSLYATQLKDEAGANIELASISTMTLTMQDALGNVVNSRNAQSVLNANGGTVSSSGAFTFTVTPSDTTRAADGGDPQVRHMTFIVTHSGGKKAPHQVTFYIKNLAGIS